MATFEKSSARMVLSKPEHKLLVGSMDTLLEARAMQADAAHRRNSTTRKKIQTPLWSSLMKQHPKAFAASKKIYLAEKAKLLSRKRKSSTNGRRVGGIEHPHAVYGLDGGFEIPAYDASWEYPTQGLGSSPEAVAVADPTSGRLECDARTTNISEIVHTGAGVMFWYYPRRSGVLNIQIAPSIEDFLICGCWFDEGDSTAEISLGIQRYALQPFTLVDWAAKQTTSLDFILAQYQDVQYRSNTWDRDALYVSAPIDVQYVYACWAWISASVHKAGDGFANSTVKAMIDVFDYWVN